MMPSTRPMKICVVVLGRRLERAAAADACLTAVTISPLAARLDRRARFTVGLAPLDRLALVGDARLRFLALGFFGHESGPAKAGHYVLRPIVRGPIVRSVRLQADPRASLAARSTAAIMLSGSAMPLPAISNAVP